MTNKKGRRFSVYMIVLILLLGFTAAVIYGLSSTGKSGSGWVPHSGSGSNAPSFSQTYYIYDTVVNIKLYGEQASQRNLDDIKQLLERLDRELSRTKEGGEVYEVNRLAGVQAVPVSDETLEAVKLSLNYAKEMGGLFDPTIGPLVDLWGIGTENARVPQQHEIDEALKLINYKAVLIDETAKTIKLARKGMVLDLGGIGKGYAADKVADYLRSQGITSALIDLGGSSIITLGAKPDGSLWNIGLQDPDQSRGTQLGTIKINNEVIDDSGVYERFFMQDGIRYHHILDPRTGFPAQNGIKSLTIMSPKATDADALSTGVFLMGVQDGLAYLEALPEKIEAFFVTDDNKIYATPGLKSRLNITDSTYSFGG
ncbi:FAD:protein FMN transferase [Paenibacillus physcomitrellae]|uniref:FAD:protein FMN transferase n=1 Tax=Paenibacillus physcomitrellae TaxID=1619311 RepID=A0ABQ1FSL3_9BACL|nr:FAD:protein FMN transferase [Paenibacillus physcomitrellae]GGA27821.1 FAD:protein FMN transferase [Paenibacillus physcomitrellae]